MSTLKVVRERVREEGNYNSSDLRGLGSIEILNWRSHEPALFVDFIDETYANSIAKELSLNFTYVIDSFSRKVGLFYRQSSENNPVANHVRLCACAHIITQRDSQISCHLDNICLLKHSFRHDEALPSLKEAAAGTLETVNFESVGLSITAEVIEMLRSNTESLPWGSVHLSPNMNQHHIGELFRARSPHAGAVKSIR